jgi:hypothetical protein
MCNCLCCCYSKSWNWLILYPSTMIPMQIHGVACPEIMMTFLGEDERQRWPIEQRISREERQQWPAERRSSVEEWLQRACGGELRRRTPSWEEASESCGTIDEDFDDENDKLRRMCMCRGPVTPWPGPFGGSAAQQVEASCMDVYQSYKMIANSF